MYPLLIYYLAFPDLRNFSTVCIDSEQGTKMAFHHENIASSVLRLRYICNTVYSFSLNLRHWKLSVITQSSAYEVSLLHVYYFWVVRQQQQVRRQTTAVIC